MPRPLGPVDLEPAVDLWRAAGGWYRTTLPISEAMVRTALERLVAPPSMFARRTTGSAVAQVIPGEGGALEAMVYVKADGGASYAAPVLRERSQTGGDCTELLDIARTYLRERSVPTFLVEAPTDRTSVRSSVIAAGTTRWRRSAYLKQRPTPIEPDGPGVVAFRSRWAPAVVALGRRRFPDGAPPAAPVPFLDLPGPSRSPLVTPPRGTRIWVLLDDRVLLGVIGATRFPNLPTGEVGPFLLDPGADPAKARLLLRVAMRWLGESGASAIRTSLPEGLEREERALHDEGFSLVAQGDVVEVSTAVSN